MFLGKILELILSARIVSPCGAFTHAPGACGGHISDPQIVGSSGWLGLVGDFDVILADKGFLIKGQISADIETKGQISADIGILGIGGQTHEALGGSVGRLDWGHLGKVADLMIAAMGETEGVKALAKICLDNKLVVKQT